MKHPTIDSWSFGANSLYKTASVWRDRHPWYWWLIEKWLLIGDEFGHKTFYRIAYRFERLHFLHVPCDAYCYVWSPFYHKRSEHHHFPTDYWSMPKKDLDQFEADAKKWAEDEASNLEAVYHDHGDPAFATTSPHKHDDFLEHQHPLQRPSAE